MTPPRRIDPKIHHTMGTLPLSYNPAPHCSVILTYQ